MAPDETSTGTPHEQAPPSGGAARPHAPLIAVFCTAVILHVHLESVIRGAPDLQVWRQGMPEEPDVALCAVGSGADLLSWRSSPFSNPGHRAVLYSLSDSPGVLGAGLHRFRGYCPPDADEERLRQCVRRVARGQADAPHEHLATLIRLLEAPPLDDRDLKVLRLLALGRSNQQIVKEAPIGERRLGDRLSYMEALFEAESSRHLAAIITALGLGWPYEDGVPEGILIAKAKRSHKTGS
jgi:DNA-binding NarL/FixJ family response regulator